jgi:hypothetical protein
MVLAKFMQIEDTKMEAWLLRLGRLHSLDDDVPLVQVAMLEASCMKGRRQPSQFASQRLSFVGAHVL